MNEKPIERLRYYNGQRLEADDLKLEQEYHIRVRRWLNKSLYSAGIAEGLEVNPDSGSPQQVIVSPGLALDHEGREIILLEEKHIKVIGRRSKTEGEFTGNYLTIQYRDEARTEESDSCTPHGNGHNKGQLPWGGPSRVRANPILGWSDDFPHDISGKIVLAQVELDPNCNVRNVYRYQRTYARPTSLTTVRQYALEGERHIDAKNPGRIYFHIRGRQPSAVTLYLRAEKFSTLYYTELGNHNHNPSTQNASETEPATRIDQHGHDAAGLIVGMHDTTPQRNPTDGTHSHTVFAFASDKPDPPPFGIGAIGTIIGAIRNLTGYPAGNSIPPYMLRVITAIGGAAENLGTKVGLTVNPTNSAHDHAIDGTTGSVRYSGATTPPAGFPFHKHVLPGDTVNPAGVNEISSPAYSGRTGQNPLEYISGLQVYVGKVEQTGIVQSSVRYTDEILTQLKNLQPPTWNNGAVTDMLGNGTDEHPLAKNGTGAIRLDLLSPKLSFPEGQYYVDLQVTSGGGRILYNLYVE